MFYLNTLMQWIVAIPLLTFWGLMGTFIPVGVAALAGCFLGAAVLQYLKPPQLNKRIWQWSGMLLGAWVVYGWFQIYRYGLG